MTIETLLDDYLENDMPDNPHIIAEISRMSRGVCESILQNHGFHVTDDETTFDLREAIEVNYRDGTIPGDDIYCGD